MDGIEVYTTDQLVDELKRRYDRGLLVAGLKAADGAEDAQDEVFFLSFRMLTASIGLARRSEAFMTAESSKGITEVNDEEEDEEENEEVA